MDSKSKGYCNSYIQSKLSTGISYECFSSLSDQIIAIRGDVFVRELGFAISDEFVDGNEKNFLHCCLYEKENLIAYARIEVKECSARIGRVAVRKDKRNKGYGKQIMFWAETEALKKNKNDVEVHALYSAVGFYNKLGYTAVGKEFEEEGKSHILMTKHLELDT